MNSKNGASEVIHGGSLLTEHDVYLFREGTHYKLHEKLGSHPSFLEGLKGTYFAVWAPNAEKVSVMGDFNAWDSEAHPLACRWDHSGIWEGFIPGVESGSHYKYHLLSRNRTYRVDKGDPFAFYWETPPRTSSIVWDLSYEWNDAEWIRQRNSRNSLRSPISIYEVHLGSWRRVPEEGNRPLSYREMAPMLAGYVKEMGFTHVEFMPVMEHPFAGSWGYQVTGYFAPTSRFGTPQDFMYLVDYLHQQGIGVFFDWVPSHFPGDEHGLIYFDGTHLYEHADPRQGFHPDWNSYIFNYGRNEVRAFLISNALYWLAYYHLDGLRVDAVASMLYLDYSREEGEWIPNHYGGRENLEAISFIRDFNQAAFVDHPQIQTIAEESTAWPMVSRPPYLGGLGFGLKWNMGWMHDTLHYFSRDPIHRKFDHQNLTFSMWYAYQENFILPLSHDEVVHGKGSLFGKMPGDEWQKFANLRLLLGYMYGHPGKKLLFMGGEFGQRSEWNHDESLEWHLLQHSPHRGLQQWIKDLNRLLRQSPALSEFDFDPGSFAWLDFSDWEQSVISFLRRGKKEGESILVVLNFTPIPRESYRIGIERDGIWREILNSDAREYGGSGLGNLGRVEAGPIPSHGRDHSLSLMLPPLAVLFLQEIKT